MYVRVVTFSLTIATEDYLAMAAQVAPAFGTWAGLERKYWIADYDANRYGGVYLFSSKQAADASRVTELFHAMAENPAFADLSVSEYAVLDEPTRITTAVAAPGRPPSPHPLARLAGVN